MTDYKEEILERAGGSGKRYIYRGGSVEDMADELDRGRVESAEYPILTGEVPDGKVADRTPLRDVGTFDQTDTANVSGGFTDNMASTRRFRGSKGVILVIDSQDNRRRGVEKVEYTYEYMNDNPGVLPHILKTAKGEIRDKNGDLWGIYKDIPTARGSRKKVVEHSGGEGNLPATSSDSMFADESEWVNPDSPVGQTLRGGVKAVIGVYNVSGIDIVDKWEELFNTLPTLADIYTFHITGDIDGVWDESVISTAVGPSGDVVPVEDVPTALRNGDSL